MDMINDHLQIIYDEAESHIDARYLTAAEAMWRISEYDLMRRSHKVERLDIHSEGNYRGMDPNNPPEDLTDVGQKRSKLESWFALNNPSKPEYDPYAAPFKYTEIPEHYTWDGKNSKW